MRLLLGTAILSIIAAIAGAFVASCLWNYFDPLGIIEFEGGRGSVPVKALLINAVVVLPFYMPWIIAVALLHRKLMAKEHVSIGLAVVSSFLIAGLGQLHPIDFVGHLHGFTEYFASMLLASAVLILSSVPWNKLSPKAGPRSRA